MAARRLTAPTPVARSRALFAAVAIGAIAAAATGGSLFPSDTALATPLADPSSAAVVGTNADSLAVRPLNRTVAAGAEAQQLAESQEITGQQTVDGPQTKRTTKATFTSPATGTVSATFGGQYGSFHYGIEIKNVKDTPIVAAADGVIIAAGPTSGFGLWVKEQLPDGTTLVYARMDTYSVQIGQHVTAGEQIARMGDRGFGDSYTLHFEVWDPAGKKIDPEGWLNDRGVTV
ncbi:MAG TPA: M23 family metallopeptidase [Mycobacteriales bacterium]|nr:M23 family metallopeptidase [Mycobacteriales bacterium]